MPRRTDSPYSSDTSMCYPEGLGQYGETNWLAQNEGQHVLSVGLHFNDLDPDDTADGYDR
jgi:hypothetical protein